jgi:small subunit ribosomal protein S6
LVAQLTRDYELLMIISPEANEEEVTAAVERVTSFITDRGGSIIDQSNWGLRRLAYPIQNFHEGNYVLTRFSADTSDIIGLDNSLKASEDILRHLTTKIDKSVNLAAAKAKAAEPPEEEVESVETAEAEESEEVPEAVDSVETAGAEESEEVSEAVDSVETAEDEDSEETSEAADSVETAEAEDSEVPAEAVGSVETEETETEEKE